MRLNLLTLILLLFTCTSLIAQPPNDECSGLIDLGITPYCPDLEFFTNVDATESNIGSGNFPTGCSGIGDITFVGRDVFFQFTTNNTLTDYTITVTGVTDGMGSPPLMNPQIAIYRGDCLFDELSLLSCGKAADGDNEISVDLIGLDLNTPYFIRVNDWSSSAAPNSGTFKICVDELDPVYLMGQDLTSGSCNGTLFDSGGADNDYQSGENLTFTLCPDQFFSCLAIDLVSFQTEQGFDDLTIYGGDNTGAPVIANLTGAIANPYSFEATSSCVTFVFESDGSVVQPGFELTWACNAAPCPGSSIDNPTVLNGPLPIDLTGETSCNDASNFSQTPCNAPFINGPEYVYAYQSPGGLCASIQVSNAEPGTGVLVLNGPPGDPATVCVATNANGSIASANMETAGTYYIVVANANGCTDFDLSITETECSFATAIVDALCNPLNACEINPDGTPNQFPFEDGFQDVPNEVGVNNGCWFGVGFEPDYVWFSVEIQEDGPFGFILSSAGTPSDIDFNVWGPFTSDQVCDTPQEVIDFVTNNQPIRSSYAGFALPTGLTNIHPDDGYPITDEYDCNGVGIENNDQFVRAIDGIEGEHYLVLFNDFGDNIEGIVNVDWSPSAEGVLEVDLEEIIGADTVVCAGQSVQLEMPEWIDSIQWLAPSNSTLSCTSCLDPIATPTVSTQYYAYVESQCITDTVKVDVFVYDASLGPDITVCLGEDVELSTDPVYPDVVYNWTGPNLSCTTCPVAVASTPDPGNYEYTVEIVTPFCTLTDVINIEVLVSPAPVFEVANDTTLCPGETLNLGNSNNDITNTYNWTSNPPGYFSGIANPTITPTENATYYVMVSNGSCPIQSRDSVVVSLFIPPVTDVAEDTTVCQGELVTLANTTEEPGAVYSWSPADQLDDADIANPTATMDETTEFILTTTFSSCTYMDTVNVTSIVINAEIDNPNDTLLICQGETVLLDVNVEPIGAIADWTTDNNSFTASANSVVISPTEETIFFATVSVPGCSETDQITVLVDSIPSPTLIMPSDTSVCRGALVVLTSQAYLPSAYPDIVHEWTPDIGFESPDSLYNIVIEASDTITYYRTTTNGGCTVIDSATISILETTTIDIAPVDPEVCVNGSIELTASSPDITEFEWESSADLSNTEGETTTMTASSTSGPVSVMVEGEFLGCPVVQQVTVNVIDNPFANLNDDDSICPGESADLVSTPNPNVTYSWTADPGPLGFGINDTNPQATPSTTTTYMATTSNGVCPDAIETIVVEVQDGADFNNVNEDVFVCLLPELSVDVTLLVEGNSTLGSMYSWTSTPEGFTSTSANPTFTFTEAGTTLFEVTFTNDCGESATETISVTVHPGVEVVGFPEAIIVSPESTLPDGAYGEGTLVDLAANTTAPGNYTYSWTIDGAPLDSTENINLINDPTRFDVTVTDENGCSHDGFKIVDVNKPFWELPNAFTPDGDGVNDNFALLAVGKMTIQSFEIWNRWGVKVYSGTDSVGWNGTHNDKPAPMDVYIYHIVLERPSGLIEERKGDVTLIR